MLDLNFIQIVALIVQIILMLGLIVFFVSGFISSFYGAPYVPMRRKKIKNILLFGGLSEGDIFFDLGSGDGRVIISAIIDFNVRKAIGYEISFWPYLKSIYSIKISGVSSKIDIHRGDILKANISSATFIYIYLFPKIVDKLAYKFEKELAINAKILSAGFPINLDSHPKIKLIKSEKIDKMLVYLYLKI